MFYTVSLGLAAAGLFLGILAAMELGWRLGKRRLQADPEGARTGVGAVEGALFALLGLLIAFTFSGASSRFDARRQLIVEEANAIGTAYLRLDLLSPAHRTSLQDLFRQYLDARLAAYARLPDLAAAFAALEEADAVQREIWARVIVACREDASPHAQVLVLPAVNQMIDLNTTHRMSGKSHPPVIVFVMLAVVVLISSLMAGFGMAGGKSRSWIHVIGFAAILAITFYVILDLELPRVGLIQVDAFDEALQELRHSMH